MPLTFTHRPAGAGLAVAALLALGCRPASPYDDVPVTSATLVDFDHDALAILGGPVGGDALLVFDGPDGGGSIPVAMRGGMAGVALEMSLDLNPNANVELDFSRADDDVSLADLLSRYRGGAWSVGVLIGGSGRSLHNRKGVGLTETHFIFGAGVMVGLEWLRLDEGGNEEGDDWGWQDWGAGADTGWTGADTGGGDTGPGDGADSGGGTGDSGADGGGSADAGNTGAETSSGCGGGGSSSDDDDGGDGDDGGDDGDGGGSDGGDGGGSDGGSSDGGGSDGGGSDGGGSDGGGGSGGSSSSSSSSGGCGGGGGGACDSLCSSSASLSMLFLGAWGLRRRRDPGATSSPPSR